MTGEQMLDAGWEPDKVIALRWDWAGRPVELRSNFGLLSQIVPSRDYVAVLEETDGSGDHSLLTVYQGDGSSRGSFRNIVEVAGKPEVGEFLWFEPASSSSPTAFGVVFNVARTGATYQVDIDAQSGAVLGIKETR